MERFQILVGPVILKLAMPATTIAYTVVFLIL